MLGGGWISNGIFISLLERKGGPKEKNIGAGVRSQKNHLHMKESFHNFYIVTN